MVNPMLSPTAVTSPVFHALLQGPVPGIHPEDVDDL